jgi:hypothetical protein
MPIASPALLATNPYPVWTYAAYLLVSIALTVWVARTLSRNGRVFLAEAFLGNERLADSVNHLLVVGFYLINVGYATLALRYGDRPSSLQGAIEVLSTKVGIVLLVLGVMHFLNLAGVSSLRHRALLKNQPPPVAPQEYLATTGASAG